MKEKMSKFRRFFNFHKWFSNNKFVACFSLFAAFCIWLWISIDKSPIVENVIVSVPVYIETENSVPSQLGLKVFGNSNYTVDVTVSGKKFVVSSLTADDIKVTAQTNFVDSAGNKSLLLKATPAKNQDFTIVSLSENYISVYFDTYKEKEFPLEANIVTELSSIVPDGCIQGNVVFSKSTVRVSGPTTEVNKVTGVAATVNVDKVIEGTTTFTPDIQLLGAPSSDFTNTSVDIGDAGITLTVPVLKEVVLPTTVTLKNAPADYLLGSMNMSLHPSSVKVGIPVEKIDDIKEISVGTIDFNSLDAGNNIFTFKKDDITDYMITDSVEKFRVSVNMGNVVSTYVNIPSSNISVVKQKTGYEATVAQQSISNVKIVGPASVIDSLNPNNVYADIDVSQVNATSGTITVPVNISIRDNTSCWANGDYSVQVTIKPNS